ncbi:hypothetical protein ABID99_002234 [Mucilaginibacter sp. OAE612]|uniref:hypothetical protein n=1 Tax=Mucilaginibacter sp. OAE612 TaxID=3156444 RepID=UPI00359D133C
MMFRIKSLFKRALFLFCCFLAAISLPFGCGLVTSVGGSPGKDDTTKYALQSNYVNSQFQNLKYADDTQQAKRISLLRMLFSHPDSVKPPKPSSLGQKPI